MSDTPPKSAVELAMEKLRKKDVEAGLKVTSLTDVQTEAIANTRRNYEAQVAQSRILHESAMQTALDPDARAEFEANYRRDLSHFASDRDKKIDKIRQEND